MISPVMLLCIIYTLVDSFTDIKNSMLSYIQEFAFRRTQFEYAAAMGWIYFAFIIVLVVVIMAIMKGYIYTTEAERGGKRRARKNVNV